MATVASLKDLDTTLTSGCGHQGHTAAFQMLKTAYAKVYGEHDLRLSDYYRSGCGSVDGGG
jgi:hypothetical protein